MAWLRRNDTGWRDISALSSIILQGRVLTRWRHNKVHYRLEDVVLDANANVDILTLPLDFRPERIWYGETTKYWAQEQKRTVRIHTNGVMRISGYQANDMLNLDAETFAARPFPSTLPGVSA